MVNLSRTILLGAALAFGGTLSAENLFNGKDLDGWKFLQRNTDNADGFIAENRVIHTRHGKGMLWYTKKKLGNGTLRVVYKMKKDQGNSGVFIRIPIEPQSEWDAINKGIEIQIDDQDDEYHSTGTMYSMTKAKAKPSKALGQWNTMEITMTGLRTVIKVNGILVTDYDGVTPVPDKKASYEPDRGPRPEYGYIGLQNHDDKSLVTFREISWTPAKK